MSPASRKWGEFLAKYYSKRIAPTPENVEKAKAFLLVKWKERAKQCYFPEPEDLHSGCRFASLFGMAVFGGDLEYHRDHTWVNLPGYLDPNPHVPANVLDLTGGVDVMYDFWNDGNLTGKLTPKRWEEYYTADHSFMFEPDGIENADWWDSTESCMERVNDWVREFLGLRKRRKT